MKTSVGNTKRKEKIPSNVLAGYRSSPVRTRSENLKYCAHQLKKGKHEERKYTIINNILTWVIDPDRAL